MAELPKILANIPAFPPVVLRVLDLAGNDDVELAELSEIITSDAVFAAQLLRLVNSPLYARGAGITSLHHAVVTLGVERLQGLAATVATGSYLRSAMHLGELRRCWRHTLASAILARELAVAAKLPEDQAYTLGLLHDVGRLGLLAAAPHEYARMLREADRDPIDLLDEEQRLFGADHCEIGRLLAHRWNLGPEFAIATGRHHDPPSGAAIDMQGAIHFACRLADLLGFAVLKPLKDATFEELISELPPVVAASLAAGPEELAAMVAHRVNLFDGCAATEPPAGSDEAEVPEPAQAESELLAVPASRHVPPVQVLARENNTMWGLVPIFTAVFTAVILIYLYFE